MSITFRNTLKDVSISISEHTHTYVHISIPEHTDTCVHKYPGTCNYEYVHMLYTIRIRNSGTRYYLSFVNFGT